MNPIPLLLLAITLLGTPKQPDLIAVPCTIAQDKAHHLVLCFTLDAHWDYVIEQSADLKQWDELLWIGGATGKLALPIPGTQYNTHCYYRIWKAPHRY